MVLRRSHRPGLPSRGMWHDNKTYRTLCFLSFLYINNVQPATSFALTAMILRRRPKNPEANKKKKCPPRPCAFGSCGKPCIGFTCAALYIKNDSNNKQASSAIAVPLWDILTSANTKAFFFFLLYLNFKEPHSIMRLGKIDTALTCGTIPRDGTGQSPRRWSALSRCPRRWSGTCSGCPGDSRPDSRGSQSSRSAQLSCWTAGRSSILSVGEWVSGRSFVLNVPANS